MSLPNVSRLNVLANDVGVPSSFTMRQRVRYLPTVWLRVASRR